MPPESCRLQMKGTAAPGGTEGCVTRRPKEHRVQRGKSKKQTLYIGLDLKENPVRFQMPLLAGGVSIHWGPLSPYGKTVPPTNALMPQLSLWRLSLHTYTHSGPQSA